MADSSIRKDFVDGTYEIFTTLFNDGETDGIKLYQLSDKTEINIYNESKYKVYKKPITLVSHVRIDSEQGKQDVEKIKHRPSFTVPLKSFENNGISVDRNSLDELAKGMIEFQGIFYSIDEVLPRVYIDGVFIFYHFACLEERGVTSLLLEESEDGDQHE